MVWVRGEGWYPVFYYNCERMVVPFIIVPFTDLERVRSGAGSGLGWGQGIVKMQGMKIRKFF